MLETVGVLGAVLAAAAGTGVVFSHAPPERHEIVQSRLFVGTSSGAYESNSWGEQWQPMGDRLPGRIRAFACLGPRAFAGGVDGLYLSEDYGETWSHLEGWKGPEVNCILTSSFFALEPVVFVGAADGLYRSRDGGIQWERVGAGVVSAPVYALAWPGPLLFAATSSGLFGSDDGGDTFSRRGQGIADAPLLSLALSRFFGQDPVAFVGSDGEGLWRSRDGGDSFVALGQPARTVYSLFWWKASLLAGTDAGLFISHDAGEAWESVAPDLRGAKVFAILVPAPDSAGGSDVFLGTERGVFKSSDGGLSWRQMTDGLGQPLVFSFGTFPVPTEDAIRRRGR